MCRVFVVLLAVAVSSISVAQARVRVRAEVVDWAGEFDVQRAKTGMVKGEGAIRTCYERGLVRRPRLQGSVLFSITFTGAGSVGKMETSADTLGDIQVVECLRAAISGWRFPPAQGGRSAVIKINWTFTTMDSEEKAAPPSLEASLARLKRVLHETRIRNSQLTMGCFGMGEVAFKNGVSGIDDSAQLAIDGIAYGDLSGDASPNVVIAFSLNGKAMVPLCLSVYATAKDKLVWKSSLEIGDDQRYQLEKLIIQAGRILVIGDAAEAGGKSCKAGQAGHVSFYGMREGKLIDENRRVLWFKRHDQTCQ